MTKAIYCTSCMDIKAIPRVGRTVCACGNMQAEWTDALAGRVLVIAERLSSARILGLHNMFLISTPRRSTGSGQRNEFWRTQHDSILKETPAGYLFRPDNRNCWAIIIGPGESADIEWRQGPAVEQTPVTSLEHDPPFDGSPPCPMCPLSIRRLSASSSEPSLTIRPSLIWRLAASVSCWS